MKKNFIKKLLAITTSLCAMSALIAPTATIKAADTYPIKSSMKNIGYTYVGSTVKHPEMYSHIILSFAKASGDTNGTVKYQSDVISTGGHAKGSDSYNKIKKQAANLKSEAKKNGNSNLKVLIALGGGDNNQISAIYKATSTSNAISTLAQSLVSLVNNAGLDGVDLDWEYWGDDTNFSYSEACSRYKKLAKKIKETNGFGSHTLSVAALADKTYYKNSNIIDMLKNYADIVNLMTYDYNTGRTLPNSPFDSVNSTISDYISKGVPAKKIAMGIPFYGRLFLGTTSLNVKSSNKTEVNYKDLVENTSLSDQSSTAKSAIQNARTQIKNGNVSYYGNQKTDAYVKGSNYILFYDNPKTIGYKLYEAAFTYKIGGIMCWQTGADSSNCELERTIVTYLNKHKAK